jgi:phage gpG-like protein
MAYNLTKLLEKQTKEVKLKIAKEIARISVRHFKAGFRSGGGQTDAGKWEKRKNDIDPKRAILVKTGSLRDSVKIYKINADQIIINSNLPYSGSMNYGYGDMPAREFMGPSHLLDRKILNVVDKMLKENIK